MTRYKCPSCSHTAPAPQPFCPDGHVGSGWIEVDDELDTGDGEVQEPSPGSALAPDSNPLLSPLTTPLTTPTDRAPCDRCGHVSSVGIDCCEVCGGPLSSAAPVAPAAPAAGPPGSSSLGAGPGSLVAPPPLREQIVEVALLGRPDAPIVVLTQGSTEQFGRAVGPLAQFLGDGSYPNVSGTHVEVRLGGTGCVLRDLNSTNGTFIVDGERLVCVPTSHWYAIIEGQSVQLGNFPDRANARLEFTWGVAP